LSASILVPFDNLGIVICRDLFDEAHSGVQMSAIQTHFVGALLAMDIFPT